MHRNLTQSKHFLTGCFLLIILIILVVGIPQQRIVTAMFRPAGPLVVTNVADSGAGSLRQAITDANSTPGTDTINFAIGTGAKTIAPLSALPVITDPVIIDATTQPGFTGTPLIELNGASIVGPAIGLFITAGSSTVKGLIINRFNTDGIRLSTGNGNTISGNYIGTNAAGTAASANLSYGIEINESANNTIGGTTAAARNIISGNAQNGLLVTGNSSTGNLIQGNFIGTDAAGTAAVGNGAVNPGNINGVIIGGSNNTVGGTTAGARNIISGNGNNGLELDGTNNTAQGNYVGTDVTGNVALGNFRDGIIINGTNDIIGGTTAAARNVVAGNNGIGIDVCCGGGATGNQVQGNYIGLGADGLTAVGNSDGVRIASGNKNNTIGGTAAGARNIISGNFSIGVELLEIGTSNNLVQGNYIGLNLAGTAVISTGSYGVYISSAATANTVGGTSAGAANVISGHSVANVAISSFGTTGNQIIGNLIGTQADGTSQLSNGGSGVSLYDGAANNFIGNTTAGSGNVIAFNGQGGIRADAFAGNGNALLRNSIFSNGALGIDLNVDGVTANDNCDSDSGPNLRQNYPVLTAATTDTTNTTILGALNSTASTQFRLEFFSSPSCDPTHTQGKVFLGTTNVTTNASCTANINFAVPNASVVGSFITTTATDPNNNTSEFSACVQQMTSNAVFQFSAANYNVGEGDGSVTITINRTVNTAGLSTVDFNTGNNEYRPCTPGDPQNIAGLATQNCDFIRTQGTLTFNPGDTSKTFSVLVADDAHFEGIETFPITLTNPVGGALGLSTTTVSIADNDTALTTLPAPFRFAGALTGTQETPANNSNGAGTGVVLLSQNQTSEKVGLLWSNLGSAQTVQHIHGAAVPGIAAPILFTLPNGTPVTNFQINGLTAQQVGDLKSGLHYLNVHSNNFQGGEIRGQLLWNPTLEENFFVNEHYYDFLQRLPDAGGFNFWTGQISFCAADAQCLHNQTIVVSNAFFYEQEYQQTGAYAYRLFREAFGNIQPAPNPDGSNATEANKIPSYDAYSAIRARVVGGANLTAGQQDAANVFVNAPQFLARYPANQTLDQFVDAVLGTIMTDIGVNLTSQRTALIALGSRAAVLYRLANDDLQGGNGGINNRPFIDAEYNRAFVVTQYFGYLRRDGDIGGILFWLGQVNGAPLRDISKQNAMVCSFITSGEYQLRFGPKVPRTNKECPQ